MSFEKSIYSADSDSKRLASIKRVLGKDLLPGISTINENDPKSDDESITSPAEVDFLYNLSRGHIPNIERMIKEEAISKEFIRSERTQEIAKSFIREKLLGKRELVSAHMVFLLCNVDQEFFRTPENRVCILDEVRYRMHVGHVVGAKDLQEKFLLQMDSEFFAMVDREVAYWKGKDANFADRILKTFPH